MPFPGPPSSFETSFMEAAQAAKKDNRVDNLSNKQIQGTIVYCLDFFYPGHNFMHHFLTKPASEFATYLTSCIVSELNKDGNHEQAQQVTDLAQELANQQAAQAAQEVPADAENAEPADTAEPIDDMVEMLNRLNALYPGQEFTQRFLTEPRPEFTAFLSSFGMSVANAHGDHEQAQQLTELARELGSRGEQCDDENEPPFYHDQDDDRQDIKERYYYAEDEQRHQ